MKKILILLSLVFSLSIYGDVDGVGTSRPEEYKFFIGSLEKTTDHLNRVTNAGYSVTVISCTIENGVTYCLYKIFRKRV